MKNYIKISGEPEHLVHKRVREIIERYERQTGLKVSWTELAEASGMTRAELAQWSSNTQNCLTEPAGQERLLRLSIALKKKYGATNEDIRDLWAAVREALVCSLKRKPNSKKKQEKLENWYKMSCLDKHPYWNKPEYSALVTEFRDLLAEKPSFSVKVNGRWRTFKIFYSWESPIPIPPEIIVPLQVGILLGQVGQEEARDNDLLVSKLLHLAAPNLLFVLDTLKVSSPETLAEVLSWLDRRLHQEMEALAKHNPNSKKIVESYQMHPSDSTYSPLVPTQI